MMTKGEYISTLRKSRGMTQKELADKSGVNIRQIQKYEHGDLDVNNMTLVNAQRLAEALGVTSDDLLRGPQRRYAQIAQKVAADIGTNGFRILQRYAHYIKTTEVREFGIGFVQVTYLDEQGQIVAENSGGLIDWYPMIGEIIKI